MFLWKYLLSVVILIMVPSVGIIRAGVEYVDPPGGWSYIYLGNTAAAGDPHGSPGYNALDGTWSHENDSDSWDGTGMGSGNPGGVSALSQGADNFARLQDAYDYDPGSDPSNRKLYFGHSITTDIGSAAENLLDNGVTISLRARLATTAPLDDLNNITPWPVGGDGYTLHSGGKGNFGIRQSTDHAIISFCLALESDHSQSGSGPGLIMNCLNGSTPSTSVDPGDAGSTFNILTISDLTVWHEFWITIETDSSATGTHKIKIYRDGSLIPEEFFVTAGLDSENDYEDTFLALGMGRTGQAGAIDVDFFAYRQGCYEPTSISNQPPSVDAGLNQTIWWPYQKAVPLDATVTDDDPCNLGEIGIDYGSLQWSQISGPGTITFDPCASVQDPTARIPATGIYKLSLQAADEILQDACDVMTITAYPSLLGDLNLDFKVDIDDLELFILQWLDPPGCPEHPTGCADLTGSDNGVDIEDFNCLSENWQKTWPLVTILAPDPNAAEAGPNTGQFSISRTDTEGNLTVQYEVGGTAEPADYNETLTGQITIPDGWLSETITITPYDDSESEGSETVELTLIPGDGYQIGTPDSAAVTIVDDDFSGIESADLIVEMNVNPYSYTVTEKSTLQVLISQSETNMNISGVSRKALSAYNVQIGLDWMEATLDLEGTTETGYVKFSFEDSDVVKVFLNSSAVPTNVKEEFTDQGEHYYGIWEYPQGGHIDNRGADRDLIGFWSMDDTNFANARAPFYVTTRKYGIYVDTLALGHYTIAQSGKTSFDFDEADMTYYVIYGPTYENIFDEFNDLAGPARMPPDWAFDSIWWRNDDSKEFGYTDLVENRVIDSAEDNVIATANHLQYYRIPASAVWIDRPFTSGDWGWGQMNFNPADDWFPSGTPNGQYMIDYLENKGYKFLLWIANRCAYTLKTEGEAYGYLFTGYTSRPAADVRDPCAYNWFKNHLDTFAQMGVRGYKIDRGHENEQPDELENEIVYLFRKLAAEVLMDLYGADYLMYARNAYDKNRRHVGVWNGDSDSDFGGLAIAVKNGLRCGAINSPHYGSDIGGYFGDHPSEELYTRWLQFGTYCTFMEIMIENGHDTTQRTIWYDYYDPGNDPNLVDIARLQCEDHHDLIPYTKSCMYEAHQNGMPVMKQLIFAYPDDPNLYDMWDEYLYGPEILVAPVLTQGATSRTVYLPSGKWLDYNDKSSSHIGPTNITASAPIDIIPLFVKAGAIIPRGDILQSNNNWTPGWTPYLRIEFFPCENTDNTFDYYTGSIVRPINCAMSAAGVINIQFDDLAYSGTLEVYTQQYSTVSGGSGHSFDPAKNLLTINFSGATNIEITGAQSIF